MPTNAIAWIWAKRVAPLVTCLLLLGCATAPPPSESPAARKGDTWAGRPVGAPPAPRPALRRSILKTAAREWEFFGRQTVVLHGTEESIPHVGLWEDEDYSRSDRVRLYWRAVNKSNLSGRDCQQPWSAAFTSWVMQTAGVPESQFRPATAHWVYLTGIVDAATEPGRYFVPRRITDYSPREGDLICASRGGSRPSSLSGYTDPDRLRGANTHCDIVIQRTGQTLEVIGGNVRNSVSRTTLELDAQGHLQPVQRRPWFLILENRL